MGWKLLVVLALLVAGCSHQPPAYESHYTPPATTVTGAHPAFDPATVGQALQTDRPYTIAVLGDSTGNGVQEWVHLLGKRIATAYQRQVTVHDWDVDANTYGKDTVYGSGVPVTIWNASGAGKSAQWSVEHFAAQVPQPVDLTFINHGHNDPEHAEQGIEELVELAYGKGTGGVVVVLQNPRADNPDRAALEANIYRQIGDRFNHPGQGTVAVDVFSAFPTGDALPPLLMPDRAHPNEAGQQLWVDTVAAALQLRQGVPTR
jgi:lysophospholipase L1-like esterase